MTKKARILRTKEFLDEIKSIFHRFQMAFIEANQTIFLEGESPTLRLDLNTKPKRLKIRVQILI